MLRHRVRLARHLGLACALLGGASAAHAGAIPFTAQLALRIATLQPVVVNGAGVATVNGSAGGIDIDSLQVPADALQTVAALVPITDPAAFPIAGVQLTVANGAGNFVGSGGTMPLPGIAKVCLFGLSCATAAANVSVPLSGVGTSAVATVVGDAINLTVVGAAWTTGTAVLGFQSVPYTAMGFRHGPEGRPSSTAAPSGQIQLVTPVLVYTNIGSSSVIPAFAILTLHFVPEPGTMLLIGSGPSLLAIVGRRRSRAR